MRANEIMIGDWIYAIDDNGEKHPCRVNDIKYDYINKRDDFCVDFYGTGYDPEWPDITFNVEPIPLTHEILEKNGFEKSKVFVEWKYENDNVYMIYKPFPYFKIQTEECVVAFPCEYIHELQHALRLCGIEKEIVL